MVREDKQVSIMGDFGSMMIWLHRVVVRSFNPKIGPDVLV